MAFLSKLQKVVDAIIRTIMFVLFFTMFIITAANVFMRYVLNSPIIFSVELGRYCLVSLVYLGAIYVMRENGHIGLDFFVGYMPKRVRWAIEQAGRVLMMAFLIVFTWCAVRMVLLNTAVRSSALQIPMAIPYSTMVIGGFGMMLELVRNFIYFAKSGEVELPKKEET